ncbi:MAG TPA: alpha/beta hydrolase [Alphaproteobacteria bacterium]|nr:alpha/beta hydrolase [Alphaproteobacteria bacterium]
MISFIATIVAAYVLVVGLLFALQRFLLYPANQFRPMPAQLGLPEMQVVSLRTPDGLDVIGWYAPPRGDRITVASFHGNGDFIGANAEFARQLINRGFGVLLASYRGYSGNPGSPSEAGLYEDGRAAMDFLESRGARVVLQGFSLGSGVAVQLATERKVAGLILEAPFTSAVDVAAAAYPFVPVRWLMLDRYHSLAKIAGIDVPILVTHGTRDEVIPADQFDRLYEAIKAPKSRAVFQGATHVDLARHGSGRAALSFVERLDAARAQ